MLRSFGFSRIRRGIAIGSLSASVAIGGCAKDISSTDPAPTGALPAENAAATGTGAAAAAPAATAAASAAAPAAAAAAAPAAGMVQATGATLPIGLAARLPAAPTAAGFIDVAALIRTAATAAGVEPAKITQGLDTQMSSLLAEEGIVLPAGVTIKASALTGMVIGGWEEPESYVVVLNGEAVTGLTEGAEPLAVGTSGYKMALRGGKVVLGIGVKFDDAAAAQMGETFDPAKAWPEAWTKASTNTVAAVLIPSFANAKGQADPVVQSLGLTKAAGYISANGALSILLDAANDDAIRKSLGFGQKTIADQLAALKMQAPPFAQGWVAYLELVTNGLWSRLQLTRTGTTTEIGLIAPTCGTIAHNIVPLALLAVAMGDVPDDLSTVTTTFTPVQQRVAAGCAVVPGPAPALPRQFAGLAGMETTGDKMLILADVGAFLRAQLPQMLGLLPFALDPADVKAAMGPAPLGLAGLEDPKGYVAAFIASGPAGEERTIIAPPGVQTTIPIPVDPTGFSGVIPDIGFVSGTLGADERAKAKADPNSTWTAIVNALPAKSVFSMVFPASQLDQIGPQYRADIPELQNTKLIAISLTDNLGFSLHLAVDGDAAAVAAGLPASINKALDKWTANQEGLESQRGKWLEGFNVSSPAAGIVTISLKNEANGLVGAAALIGGFAGAALGAAGGGSLPPAP